MEAHINDIHFSITLPDLKRAIATVLHGRGYEDHHTLPLNFAVSAFRRTGVNIFSAKLTLPSVEVGKRFMREYGGRRPRSCLKIEASHHTVTFRDSKYDPFPELVQRLKQTPYIDPVEEEEQLKLAKQLRSFRVSISLVQFGRECRDDVFSVEHERQCEGTGRLRFDGEHRQFRLRIHQTERNFIVAMRASQISCVSVGMEPDTKLCVIFFSLFYPPTFESEPASNAHYEDQLYLSDYSNYALYHPDGPSRLRLSSLDAGHGAYAAHTSLAIRVVCETKEDILNFIRICQKTHIPFKDPHCFPVAARNLFSSANLEEFARWLPDLHWAIAFQVDALFRAGTFDPQELLHLRPHLAELVAENGVPWTASFLRHLGSEAREPKWTQSQVGSDQADTAMKLFSHCKDTFIFPPSQDTREETFDCYHARVTPTRVLLEGPFPERTNRVMRRHLRYTSKFLRVSFVDENGLKFRFEQDVDGHRFIQERFGGVLSKGLTVGGRHFEFLAYSQSGLRQHSVWFVRSWIVTHTIGGVRTPDWVTPDSIIDKLGVFHGIPQDPKLMHCPARYGARIAQAFTSTEAAVEVEVGEIIHGEDIMDAEGRRSFTDGVGLMSMQLAEDIWDALRKKSVSRRRAGQCMPKAIQIRFQGYKGMFSVDPGLPGRAIYLRPSMKKFEARHSRTVEVAGVFNKPACFYLNRPLIMLLEGLQVRGGYQVFKQLQDVVIRETKEAAESTQGATRLCEGYGLGTAFRLASVFGDLAKLGIKSLEDSFSRKVLNYGIHHVLRDLKYSARIPVPGGYSLVGVADIHGYLKEGEIFACVARNEDEEPTFLEGWTMIARSPVIHPGDVQMVKAIGRPPPGTVFDIEPLTNTVVFSTKGVRPLASCLAGGDLDGDTFVCTTMEALLPALLCPSAEYDSAKRKTLPHESTRQDVADFVVEYLYSDRIGIIASTWLILADQSDNGIFDEDCLRLASLHSSAVDYPKTGNPVPPTAIPRYKLPNMKPDWSAPELTEETGIGLYYQSRRYIGRLFREIELSVPATVPPTPSSKQAMTATMALESFIRAPFEPRDAVEKAVHAHVSEFYAMEPFTRTARTCFTELWKTFRDFVQTLREISVSFSISHRRLVTLTEEEIVVGTIIAQSSQPRVRQDAVSRMREQSSVLVNRVAGDIAGPEDGDPNEALKRAWLAYRISTLRRHEFGFRSFGLIAMHAIFVAIRSIQAMEELSSQGDATT